METEHLYLQSSPEGIGELDNGILILQGKRNVPEGIVERRKGKKKIEDDFNGYLMLSDTYN